MTTPTRDASARLPEVVHEIPIGLRALTNLYGPAFRQYKDRASDDTETKRPVHTRPMSSTQLYLCRIVQIVLLRADIDRPRPRRYLTERAS